MNREECERMQQALFEAVDSGADLTPELREHVSTCEACRTYRRQLSELGERLGAEAGPVVPLPDGFTSRVMSAVATTPSVRERRRLVLRLLRPAIAAAAACLLVGAAWLVFGPSRPPVNTPSGSHPIGEIADATDLLLNDAASTCGDPLAETMGRALDDTRQLGDSLLAAVPIELIPGVDREFLRTLVPVGDSAGAGATTNPNSATKG